MSRFSRLLNMIQGGDSLDEIESLTDLDDEEKAVLMLLLNKLEHHQPINIHVSTGPL